MLEFEDRSRRWRLILAPIVLLFLLALITIAAGPKVQSVSPDPSAAAVSPSQPVRIAFNRPMSRPSVERHLAIDPAVPGEFRWQGSVVTFEPSGGWPEGQEVTVQLAPGARSSLFLPLLAGRQWRFRVRQAQVAYLVAEEGRTALRARAPQTGAEDTLGPLEQEVLDYDLAAAGGRLAVVVRQADGVLLTVEGANLPDPMVVERCPLDRRCRGITLSPQGDWLAWEEQPLIRSPSGVLQPGPTAVWARAVDGGSSPEAIGGQGSERRAPHWVADDRLAYYDADRRSLVVVERSESNWFEVAVIANQLGDQWTWSPDGRFVVFPEVEFIAESLARQQGVEFFSHLYRVEVETGLRTDLSAGVAGLVEDASPSFSPDGLWLAFARKSLDPAEWTLGRQLWLMRSDGSGARALTTEPAYNHAQIAWRPDSAGLAYVRFDQRGLDQPSEIWWYDLESGESGRLVERGYAPQWIP